VRSRVARDLHDDVGSGLSEIAILSELAGNGNGRPEPRDPALREIGDTARRLVDSMSDIVWSTDPRRDDVASLVARIRQFAANTLESRGIRWTLDVPPDFEGRTLDPETRRQVFLIVKEALTNVARHSACRNASLRVVPGPRDVSLEIVDDGSGIGTSPNGGGHGLANMEARAAGLGGFFRVDSAPAAGTRILVRVPLDRPAGVSSA
jgi:signal transduction histidine kinase